MNMERKNFTKLCPSCGGIQTYTTKGGLQSSIKENWGCNKCSSPHKKKTYDSDIINEVVKQYEDGVSVSKIASNLRICKRNIKPILVEKNVWIDNRDDIKKTFNEDEINDIINKYINEGLGCETIGKSYGVSKKPILRILKERGLLREGVSDGKKIELSEEQIIQIKTLYINERKFSEEISKVMGLGKHFVDKILNKLSVKRSVGESISIRQTGKKRSERVRKILKSAQQTYAKSGKRKQTGGVCKNYVVNGIKCQGTYEKFYIEKLVNENEILPNNSNSIETPFGVYYPDFSFDNKLIEIKCDYTYDILLGKKLNRFTKKIDTTQYEKIKWVNENITPVEIIIVDKRENKLIKKEIR